jgi:glycosyltransferase involved in cell wall biosynthesis
MKLSVIIPTLNEDETIEEIINRVVSVPLNIEKEIIVVDDGSSGAAKEKLRELRKKYDFTLLEHSKNQGKGAAIRTGLSKTTGDFVIIQDADLEYDPNNYEKLIKPLLNNEAEVVYGSRLLGGNRRGHLSFYLGGKMLTFLSNLLYGLNITDESTCYKVFKKDLINSLNLKSKGFEFCPEVTAKIGKRGIKIHEVPISYRARTKKEGKKIKWKDGLIAIWILIKYRF